MFLAVIVILGVWVPLHDKYASFIASHFFERLATVVASSFIIPDFMLKAFFHRTPVEMNHALSSRPLKRATWNRFILCTEILSSFTLALPLICAVLAALLGMRPFSVLMVVLLAFTSSLANSLFICTWRRAPGNRYTLPLLFVALFYITVAMAYGIFTVVYVSLWHQSSHVTLLPLGLIILMSLVCACLYAYFSRLRNYNEYSDGTVGYVHSNGRVSLLSIQWMQVLRCKNLRRSVILIAVLFIFNTYLQQQPDIIKDSGINIMLLFGITMPSLILAQYGLGVEANYIGFLWTRPCLIEQIMRNKFRFFCLLNLLMALCCIPACFLLNLSPMLLISATLYGTGAYTLPLMATCIYTNRLPLYAKTFFHNNGGMLINIVSLVLHIPIAGYFAIMFLLPANKAYMCLAGLGLLGLLLHRPYIHFLYLTWYRRRHKLMERWMKE